MDERMKDLTGQFFGEWEVLQYIGPSQPNSRDKCHKWLARCSCGQTKEVFGKYLKNGKSKSCGCKIGERIRDQRLIDLTGKRFGKLTVLSYQGFRNWLCQCDCGNTAVIRKNNLVKDRVSCGCFAKCRKHGLSKDPKKYREYLMTDPFRKLRSRISISINKALKSNRASKNGESILNYLPYTMNELKEHLEKQFEPWMNWFNYGGKSNDTKQSWWIDHITPQIQFRYTSMDSEEFKKCWALSNLRPLEKIANIIKGASNG